MKTGDIVRIVEVPEDPNDRPNLPLPLHGIVVGASEIDPERMALWIHEYTHQGHSCGMRVEQGKGWWINKKFLDIIEEY